MTLVSRPELLGARISAPPEFLLPRASRSRVDPRAIFFSFRGGASSLFFFFSFFRVGSTGFNRVCPRLSGFATFFLFVSFSRFRNTFLPPVAMLIAASAAFFTSSLFQISNLFFCEEIVLPMMAFSIFSFEFQLQCRDFCRAVRYHTLSAATFVANRFLAAQLRHAYSLFFLF